MVTITLKDIPPRLHRALKVRAEAHGRSLNTEVLACLEASVRSARVDIDALLDEARAIRRSLPIRLTQRDLVAARAGGRF